MHNLFESDGDPKMTYLFYVELSSLPPTEHDLAVGAMPGELEVKKISGDNENVISSRGSSTHDKNQ